MQRMITIGVFDGVHLGHQKILGVMKNLASAKSLLTVISFTNHPQSFLQKKPIDLIYSPEEKVFFLEKYGVTEVDFLPFDQKLAFLSYIEFLQLLQQKHPFSHLVLGENASFGKNREGTPEKIKQLSEEMHFVSHYVPKLDIDRTIVSSTLVRKSLQKNDFAFVEKLLGRKFSLLYKETTTPLLAPGLYEVFLDNIPLKLKIMKNHHMHLSEKVPLLSELTFIRRLS